MNIRNIGLAVMLIGAAPLALMALLATPNEYEAMGQAGVDCDGPLSVLIFAVPALAIYVPGFGIFARQALRKLTEVRIVAAIICLVICGVLSVQISRSVAELKTAAHQETCASGL